MPHNFTVQDLAATPVAFMIFAAFLVPPGYVLGSLLDVFEFQRRTVLARVAISICLSIAVVPIIVYLNWLYLPAAPWLVCAISWVALPFVIARQRCHNIGRKGPIPKQRVIVLSILAGWLVVATLCLIDLQIGHRLYFPIVAHDYTVRSAITAAIVRAGVPPPNPFFYSGHSYLLRYHYFWYMLCGLVGRFGGPFVTARIDVIAGTLWSGLGLVAVVTLYVRFFLAPRPRNPDKRMLVAVALLGVTGLDILPLAAISLVSGKWSASSEWWNEQVTSWVNAAIWEPHSIASLVACTTGFLVLREASKSTSVRVRISGATIGGAAFASGLGLSIYVTFVFGLFLVAWVGWLLFSRRWRDAAIVCVASLTALAASIPYLANLLGDGTGIARPIGFAIRSFYIAEAMVEPFTPRHGWLTPVANALALPLNYFLEFGFFFIVGVKQWERLRNLRRLSDEHACGIAMLGVSILVCSFLRSNTLRSNDLGWRGMLVAQFVLLIWAAELWDDALFPVGFSLGKMRFSILGWMLAVGAVPAVYDMTMLRIYPILLDDFSIPRYQWLAPDQLLGARTYALRQVYETLGRKLPKFALVQQNPDTMADDMFYGLYADRQTAAETRTCDAVFGGDAASCPGILAQINELYTGTSTLTFAQVDVICERLSIGALVVKDTDGVWGNKSSWVWARTPLIENEYSRAFLCGTASR